MSFCRPPDECVILIGRLIFGIVWLIIKMSRTLTFYTTSWHYQIQISQPHSLHLTGRMSSLFPMIVSLIEQLPSQLQANPWLDANQTCSLFAQLGARGVSVLFSSGDTGVGSACQTNDGKNTTRFLPTFPGA